MLILIILFLLSRTENDMSLVATLSPKDNQKLSKLLSKGFERSVYWNEYESKSDNKNTTSEYRYFLDSNFVGVNRLFVLIYSNQNNRIKTSSS